MSWDEALRAITLSTSAKYNLSSMGDLRLASPAARRQVDNATIGWYVLEHFPTYIVLYYSA